MSLYEQHILICTHERPPDDPKGCCMAKDSPKVLEAFKAELRSRGLAGRWRANRSGCLDQCALGTTVVIYPRGVWYVRVTPKDVPEIVDALEKNETVVRLLHPKS